MVELEKIVKIIKWVIDFMIRIINKLSLAFIQKIDLIYDSDDGWAIQNIQETEHMIYMKKESSYYQNLISSSLHKLEAEWYTLHDLVCDLDFKFKIRIYVHYNYDEQFWVINLYYDIKHYSYSLKIGKENLNNKFPFISESDFRICLTDEIKNNLKCQIKFFNYI